MTQNKLKLLSAINFKHTFMEGTDGTNTADTVLGTNAADTQVTSPPPPPAAPITFNPLQQSRVNELLAEEKRKTLQLAQQANQKTIQQLEALQQNQNLTQQERDRLAGQIEELKTQYQTKEQQQQSEYTKLQTTSAKQIKDMTGERDTWKGRFEGTVKKTEIRDASREHKAISEEQIEAIVLPITRIVEDLEDGKPTGTMVARCTFMAKDKDGKPVKLELSVSDTVKAMREWPEKYGNLFKSDSNGGTGQIPNLGSVNGGGGALPDINQMTPAQYAANRTKIRAEMAKTRG